MGLVGLFYVPNIKDGEEERDIATENTHTPSAVELSYQIPDFGIRGSRPIPR